MLDAGADGVKGCLIVVGNDPEGKPFRIAVNTYNRNSGTIELFNRYIGISAGLQNQPVYSHVNHSVNVIKLGIGFVSHWFR